MDLSKQKTFYNPTDYPNYLWVNSDDIEKFILEQFDSGSCKFSFYNEVHDSTEFICMINSLEQLEIEYNKRSNNIFEWV